MGKARRERRLPKMNFLVFRRVILYNVVILFGALCLVSVMTFRYVLEERGSARVELLQQVSESNSMSRSTMVSVMDHTYDRLAPLLVLPGARQADDIQSLLSETQAQINTFGFDYSIDVVLNNKTQYSSEPGNAARLKNLMQSYWYIKHFSGESDTSWSLRFQDAANLESYDLSYARTLYAQDGTALGVVMLNSAPSALFRTYQKLLKSGSTIYILDEHGIVISHSNTNMIGMWLYTMDNFRSLYPPDSYQLTSKMKQRTLVSNYYDPDSGWTFVEEQPIGDFFFSYGRVIVVMLCVVMFAFLMTIVQSYYGTRRISRPLIACARHMSFIRDDRLPLMSVQQQYHEIFVLSTGYNAMLGRIRGLIASIKAEEREKRRIEFDFLQAQINPHFLRNTLLGIKSLILTGRGERAADMLSAFMELLNIPIRAERELHTLHDEIEYVRRYITLMEYRYGREFSCCVYLEEGLERLLIPPLILQPLVENAIFHGLAALEEDEGILCITACHVGRELQLVVEDNGEGMTQAQIERLWQPDKNHRSINSIGLGNVCSRVKYVFGEASRIKIEAREGGGTTVRIIIAQEGEDYAEGSDR